MDNIYYLNETPDFELARTTAYQLLLQQKNPCIGMDARNVVIPGKALVFDTLQEYASVTGVSLRELTADGKISLGCHVNIADKVYLLLHNENINSDCENWTNIHEIGHICLGHENNGDKEEVEAHFFAACFLMPDPVLRTIDANGLAINKTLLMEFFNVSSEAALKKLKTLSKGDFITIYDDDITRALYRDIRYILDFRNEYRHWFINYGTLDF